MKNLPVSGVLLSELPNCQDDSEFVQSISGVKKTVLSK
jgi:hypothetical protein